VAERRAVAFTPILKGSRSEAEQVAEQLTELISANEAAGWRFCHLENVTTVKPQGCLGASATTVVHQVAIFERGSL
jgi:hypothetical protein